ncbi:ABC transporter permease [Paenibacillus glycanilyticus]|uniref:Sugar ABC transporter permease n=1 Tax=Paenibacillus glycanilyticus TaxID=126569 RepID=A0ABQ6GCL4_9BACL|nr:ABC transporter permease subunit [Paenibacillus glycanilyticus]GLX67046.1 sugar ABC transporter permease [Paenibacillus glycanilyticus]
MVRKRNLLFYLGQNRPFLLMILPAVIFFILFSYLPMAGIIVAFKNFRFDRGIFGSDWNGFGNFRFLFLSGQIWNIFKNTFFYNLAFIVTGTVFQVGVAVLLSEISSKFVSRFSQSLMFLPYFISWVIVGAFFYNLFNYDYGLVNGVLKAFGLDPVDVYSSPGMWKYILVFFNNWKWIGYGSVLYLGAILSVDEEMYEAADIDGANAFQKIFRITLPNIVPTIIIMVLLQVGNIFRGDFGMFYQLVGNNGNLYDATDIIDTYVFRSLSQMGDIPMSSAAACIQSVMCFLTISVVNGIVRKFSKENALY